MWWAELSFRHISKRSHYKPIKNNMAETINITTEKEKKVVEITSDPIIRKKPAEVYLRELKRQKEILEKQLVENPNRIKQIDNKLQLLENEGIK